MAQQYSFSRRLLQVGLTGLAIALTGCEPTLEQAIEYFPEFSRLLQPEATPEEPLGNGVQSAATQDMEAFVYQEINQIRQQEGLGTLRPNSGLAQVARQYSQQMAEGNFFNHVSPEGDTPAERVSDAGIAYWIVGENLFMGTNLPEPAPQAVEGWMNSPGHRENVLRPSFTETGVGVWRQGNTYYFTQLFMRPI